MMWSCWFQNVRYALGEFAVECEVDWIRTSRSNPTPGLGVGSGSEIALGLSTGNLVQALNIHAALLGKCSINIEGLDQIAVMNKDKSLVILISNPCARSRVLDGDQNNKTVDKGC